MRRRNSFCVGVLMMAFAWGGLAQEPEKKVALQEIIERGIQRTDANALYEAVRADDPSAASAILAMGRTNDTFWIPYLKQFSNYSNERKHGLGIDSRSAAAQVALAKLGEKKELQGIGCEAEFGSASTQYDAIHRKLSYVGGWFSIQILAGFLEGKNPVKELLRDQPSDEAYPGAAFDALIVLPKIIPEAKLSSPPALWMIKPPKLEPFRKAWQEWIQQNDKELRARAPNGEGVEVTEEVCKKVLAKDQFFDSSKLQK